MIRDADIKDIFNKYRTIAVCGMSKNEEKFDSVQHARTAGVADIIEGVAKNLDGDGGLEEIRRGLEGLEELQSKTRSCAICGYEFVGDDTKTCPRCDVKLEPGQKNEDAGIGKD